MSYDVRADVIAHRLRRAADIAAGQPTDAQISEAGGVPISALATVLMQHVSQSQLAYAQSVIGMNDSAKPATDMMTCTRRLIEYVGSLEAVLFASYGPDPTVQGDTPRAWLDASADIIQSLHDSADMRDGNNQDENAQRGLAAFKAAIERLRYTAGMIARLEQEL